MINALRIGSILIIVTVRHREQLARDQRAELTESEARYRDLLEATSEGMVIHENGTLVDANSGLARMFGYDLSDLDRASPWRRNGVCDHVH